MNSNTITIIIVTLLVAAGAYLYFFIGTGNDASLTATSAVVGNSDETKFQSLLRDYKQIKFDTTIFKDPKYTSLVKITTPITGETTNRADPFAIISGAPGK